MRTLTEVEINCDWETASRAGNDGCFQIISVNYIYDDGSEEPVSNGIDNERFFYSLEDVRENLKLPNNIEIREKL